MKKFLTKYGLQIDPEKIHRGDSVNSLGFCIGLKKTRTQKTQIRRDWLHTLNDIHIQRLLEDISSL